MLDISFFGYYMACIKLYVISVLYYILKSLIILF